jgi:GNAT superfamily N-acetyltransferase
MLRKETVHRIEVGWSERLECARELFASARVTVIAHGAAFGSYNGVYALSGVAEGALVISVPPGEHARVSDALRDRSPSDVFDAGRIAALFAGRVERIIGPASLAYVDDATFVPAATAAPVRLLEQDDRSAIDALRDACDAEEWEHGDVVLGRNPVYGAFEDDRLASVVSWEDRGTVANVGMVTHPSRRGLGLARAAASAVTVDLLRGGAMPQWQTLLANEPSIAVGRSLGYVELYRSIAIRLR